MTELQQISTYARKCYSDANCSYDEQSYYVHIQMVVDMVNKYRDIFKQPIDAKITIGAGHCHDLMEDAKQTYNNIAAGCGSIIGLRVADVTLAVTDVPAENRLMKHLLTMGKTVKDYRAIILKLCDMGSNATYSKKTGSKMYKKYVAEYAYRKPIFQMALAWYKDELDQEILAELWKELDEIHTPNLK